VTITAAIREIGRYYAAGKIDRRQLSVIHNGLMAYYLALYRTIGAMEGCVDCDADATDTCRMEAMLEDLCQRRGELAEVLQPVLVKGEAG
jgi:hypothetical protein